MTDPAAWSVEARNLPEHAANRIHTDEGAREAGFPSALVAGVTSYAYLTHPLVAAWGMDWVANGGGEVRFLAPVFAGEIVECTPRGVDGPAGPATIVDAICPAQEQNPRVTLRAVRDTGPVPAMREGERLPNRTFDLGKHFGADYARRAGDDLGLYEAEGIVSPAVWPAIGNRIMATDLVRGSWIHTRSIIRHHAAGPADAVVDVSATVVERFDSKVGKRAIVDILIEHDGQPVASLEHEAIIEIA